MKALEKSLDTRRRLVLANNPDGSLAALLDDCADAAIDVLVRYPVRTAAQFEAARRLVREALVATAADILGRAEKVLTALQEVHLLLPAKPPPAHADAVVDIGAQLSTLIGPGFVTTTGATHLGDLARYLTAICRRLDRLPGGQSADRDRMQRVHAVEDAYSQLLQALSPARAAGDDVRDIARLIQEFRVSLLAQQLGTARPVSEQRIYRAIDAILG